MFICFSFRRKYCISENWGLKVVERGNGGGGAAVNLSKEIYLCIKELLKENFASVQAAVILI